MHLILLKKLKFSKQPHAQQTAIKNCFAKFGIVQQVVSNDESELNDEFA